MQGIALQAFRRLRVAPDPHRRISRRDRIDTGEHHQGESALHVRAAVDAPGKRLHDLPFAGTRRLAVVGSHGKTPQIIVERFGQGPVRLWIVEHVPQRIGSAGIKPRCQA